MLKFVSHFLGALFFILFGLFLVMLVSTTSIDSQDQKLAKKLTEMSSDSKLISYLESEMINKQVKLKGAVWLFHSGDSNKILKVKNIFCWSKNYGGGACVQALVECAKPDGTLMSGLLEFNFQGTVENLSLDLIRNLDAEILKVYD